MVILEPANYLGSTAACVCGGGIWIGVTDYPVTKLPDCSLHAHANPHLTFLLSGGTLEKRQGSTHVRTAGETIFFHREEPHQNQQTLPGSKNLNLEFETGFFQRFGLQESDLQAAFHQKRDVGFMLLRAYKAARMNDCSAADSMVMDLLGLVGKKSVLHKAATASWLSTVSDLLRDKWNEPITLQELAGAAGVHPVTIAKQFPRYFSCTLSEFRRRLKVEKALVLLRNSATSLTEITYQCGFADQSHFSRSFKQVTGFLPNEYRKL